MSQVRILAVLLPAVLALSLLASAAFAQSVPMLFTGTATLDGQPVAAGTTIVAYSAAGTEVGRTTTGAQGQAANAFTLVLNSPSLEDQDVFFYLITPTGARLPQAGVQTQVSARYDVLGGPGRATVTIAATTPPPPPLASTALAPLINMANPEQSALNIAWVQDVTTGAFRFLAPGVVTSDLAILEPFSAVFLNLKQPMRLRISGRDPVTVPAGGRWITVGGSVTIEAVP